MSEAASATHESPRADRRTATAFVLDWTERAFLLGLFVHFAQGMAASRAGGVSVANGLLLLSESLVVVLILIRRTTPDVSRRPGTWLLAFSATGMPLLVRPCPLAPGPAVLVGALVMLLGFALEISAKCVLGRSFGCVPANRGLRLSGPYRYVRHPMYAGYLLTHVGFLCVNPSAWNLGVYLACYALQIPRLLAEESLLRADARYRTYMATVRYRLVPRVF